MTPNQRHNRRFMIHLLMISTAIFALSLGEKLRAERDAAIPESVESVARVPQSFEKGARTVIPRPQEETPSAAGSVPVELPEPEDTSLQGGLPDVQEALSGEALEASIRSTTAEAFRADLLECLNSWWLLDQGIEGQVDLEFVVDESGLKEAAVLDHSGVPFGPLTCFSSALYRTSWPASLDGEMVVVHSVVFSNSHAEVPEDMVEVDAMGEEREEEGSDTGE